MFFSNIGVLYNEFHMYYDARFSYVPFLEGMKQFV